MKAIIIGGGIGGVVAAAALQKAGWQSTIYEARPGPVEFQGLFLGLGINGMRVLRDLDLLNPLLRAETIATPVMAFSSWTGRRLGEVANGWLDAETPSITLMRGTLQRVLAKEVAARGVEIRYGRRFVGYTAGNGSVTARFEDGSEAEGDILIGADGIHSRVRKAMDPDAPEPSYTGLLNAGGIVHGAGLPPTPNAMHMVWGRRAFFGYTVREDGTAWWFANIGEPREPGRDELSATSTAEWKRRLREMFAGDPAFITRLIDATREAPVYPIYDMPSLPRWHSGRAGLLGDAAHAVSPSSGQGASLAMEDALMIAKCLRDIEDPQAALARYEQLRRDRAEKIVKTGRRRGSYKALESRMAVFLRDLFMPLALRFFADEKAMSWIYDYSIPWDVPVNGAA
ncbi:MAG: FAD-dependent oxidoreductase [Bryobacteraceae bacterium]